MVTPQKIEVVIADIRDEMEASLDAVIARLQALKGEHEAAGFTNLYIDIDHSTQWDVTSVDVELRGVRLETQEEADLRERLKEYNAKVADDYARKQYEALKAKFG